MYQKLRDLRLKKKYTTIDMGKMVGLSTAYYCQLENGTRRMSYANAVRIAKVFRKKPDFLFYDDEVVNQEKENEKDEKVEQE